MDENKEHVSRHEDVKSIDEQRVGDDLVMPESLTSLSEEDMAKLGKRATFKMDMAIMPIMVISYVLNYLDRSNLTVSKLAGIEEDLNLSPVQYQTSVSILFAGYISMQVPSNMVAGRIAWPGTYICIAMAIWGAVSALMGAVNNFSGLLATRFFLGVIEAAFFPGALYLLSMFYNRKQFALRTAVLYSGSQLGNAFGGLFAIAILELDGVHGVEGWRWLFIIEGVATIGLAIIFAFILPNSNKKIIGLSKLECEWIQWNYISDQGQGDNAREISPLKGLVMAAQDPKTWMLMGILYCTYIVGAVVNFFPSVVDGLGYDRNTTYLLTAPPFILCVITMLINGFHSDRVGDRYYHIAGALLITLAACIIAVSSLNIAARYVAMMLLPSSFYASAVVTLSWITGSLSMPTAKRASAIALINAICNTPNIWCSYLYYESPRYVTAFIVNVVAAGLAIAFATGTRFYLRRQNLRLERGEDGGKHGPTPAQIASGFRYIL